MSEPRSDLVSTSYALSGVSSHEDVRLVTDEVSAVPDVGAVAIEVTADGTTMFLKHKAGVALDRAAIDAALRRAGDYALEPGSAS